MREGCEERQGGGQIAGSLIYKELHHCLGALHIEQICARCVDWKFEAPHRDLKVVLSVNRHTACVDTSEQPRPRAEVRILGCHNFLEERPLHGQAAHLEVKAHLQPTQIARPPLEHQQRPGLRLVFDPHIHLLGRDSELADTESKCDFGKGGARGASALHDATQSLKKEPIKREQPRCQTAAMK